MTPCRNRMPRFFRIVLPSATGGVEMSIPRKIVRKYGGELSRTTTLYVPNNGRKWRVTLEKTRNGFYFREGLSEFLEYYSVGDGYFLVFRYQGNMSFKVLIFDTSACEIAYRCCGQGETSDDEDDEDDEDEDGCPVEQVTRESGNRVRVTRAYPRNATENFEASSSTAFAWGKLNRKRSFKSVEPSRSRCVEIEEVEVIDSSSSDDSDDSKAGSDPAESSEMQEDEESKIFISQKFSAQAAFPDRILHRAKKLKLENPPFMLILKKYNLFHSFMYVPIDFARRYLRRDLNSITIENTGGHRWQVLIKRERRYLSLRGCTPFFRANHLKVGDICIFELIKRNGDMRLKFQVLKLE